MLATTPSEERRRPIRCDYQDLGPELRLVLINDYEDHSADKDIWPLLGWRVAARRSRPWLVSTKERRPRQDRPHQRRPRTVGPTAIGHLMCSDCLGRNLMSQCPEPTRVCGRCESEHHQKEVDLGGSIYVGSASTARPVSSSSLICSSCLDRRLLMLHFKSWSPDPKRTCDMHGE